jgi:hypothetical protein
MGHSRRRWKQRRKTEGVDLIGMQIMRNVRRQCCKWPRKDMQSQKIIVRRDCSFAAHKVGTKIHTDKGLDVHQRPMMSRAEVFLDRRLAWDASIAVRRELQQNVLPVHQETMEL